MKILEDSLNAPVIGYVLLFSVIVIIVSVGVSTWELKSLYKRLEGDLGRVRDRLSFLEDKVRLLSEHVRSSGKEKKEQSE
jgi:hypothetical protein